MAKKALEATFGTEFQGRVLRLDYATSRPTDGSVRRSREF